MDWADENREHALAIFRIKNLFKDEIAIVEAEKAMDAIRRKAKADGMREAANQIWRLSKDEALISREVVWDAYSQINSRADAIEKGTE